MYEWAYLFSLKFFFCKRTYNVTLCGSLLRFRDERNGGAVKPQDITILSPKSAQRVGCLNVLTCDAFRKN